MDIVTYLLSRKYTDTSLIGGGAIKGKNCIISNITEITGGHRITFQWTLDDGTVENDYMDVMDGADGADGKGISSVSVNEEEHLIITYTDGTTSDAGKIEVASSVDSVNGKTGDVILNANDVGALPSNTPIPSTTSDLVNDSNFVADADYVHTDNNYDATSKEIVDGITNALSNKVDKVIGKGLSTNDYTTEDKTKLAGIAAGAEVNVQSDWNQTDSTQDDYIKNKPTAEEQTATDTFTTINGGILSSLKVSLSPNQDLHGYDSPWVGGAGKNKINCNAPTVTKNGVTVTNNGDGTFTATGTITAQTDFYLTSSGSSDLTPLGDITDGYLVTGCPNGGGMSSYQLVIGSMNSRYATDSGNGDTLTNVLQSGIRVILRVYSNYSFPTGGLTFKPMIRASGESADFASYSNICPITGHTQVDVDVSDGQTTQEQVTVNLGGTYYSGTLDVVTGVFVADKVKAVTPTRGALDSSGKLYTINFSGGTIHNYSNGVEPTPYVMCSHLDVDSLAGARTQRKCICQYAGAVYIGGYVGEETALDNMLASADFSIIFELANPTPIQLSPTMVKALVGENHLSAPLDGQEITESVYSPLAKWNAVIQDSTTSADTTWSSNKLLTEINNAVDTKVNISAIGTNETSSTASKAYSYNQYFYKDGKFCKTIAPISEGAALVLNTNYIEKTIADVIEQLEEVTIDDLEGVVGFECDFKNKTSKRLANAKGLSAGTDFDAFSIYNLRRCNLADDGTVNAYYGDTGYAEDGSNGQVMVEGNKFYYRIIPLELEKAAFGYHIRKARYYVSPYPYKGFKPHPVCIDKDGNVNEHWYGSAFEGSIYDTSESAYILDDAQVMNTSEDLFCSIANAKPASGLTQNLSKPNVEVLAQNRGNDWHCSDVQTEMAITLLMAIEYATFEFQSKIALGVVNKTDDGSTNMSNNTGATSSLGNTTGMASGTNGLVSFSWRGYENLYGNIWKHVQGLNIWGDGTMLGGQAYIATDATYNESKHDDNYEPVGFYIANGAGYVSAFGYGEEKYDWVLLPSEKLGNSSDMIGDYNWVTDNLNGYRIAPLGASWHHGLVAGRSCWALDAGVGARHRTIGARLVYKKNSK